MKMIPQPETASDIVVADGPPKRFVFISDLHFDCCRVQLPFEERMRRRENGEQVPEFEEESDSLDREDLFVEFVKERYSRDILILAGDYHTDFNKSLSFVKKLEAARIPGFFVLGNHDLASDDETDFHHIMDLFDSETRSHEYCKFLMTGKEYRHEDVCIIGATGWHPSSRFKHSQNGNRSTYHFKKELFEQESKKWLKFAKKVLKQEKKVLVVTHFPQAELGGDDEWIDWDGAKLLLPAAHSWQIFGHTHQQFLFQYFNHVCSQQGYKPKMVNSRYRGFNGLEFGKLEKVVTIKPGGAYNALAAHNSLLPYYTAKTVHDSQNELEAVGEVKSRGFKRAGHADNKRSIAAFITNKEGYIRRVKKSLRGILYFYEFMGYTLNDPISPRVVDAVRGAIKILNNESPGNNVRAFFTALVITGYAYHGKIRMIEGMRPVDDYDIVRWFLMFATMQKYNFDPKEIQSVQKNQKEHILFQGVPLHLPKVNDKSLDTAEALVLLRKTPLLEGSGNNGDDMA